MVFIQLVVICLFNIIIHIIIIGNRSVLCLTCLAVVCICTHPAEIVVCCWNCWFGTNLYIYIFIYTTLYFVCRFGSRVLFCSVQGTVHVCVCVCRCLYVCVCITIISGLKRIWLGVFIWKRYICVTCVRAICGRQVCLKRLAVRDA